jgi:hypothetical protein
MQSTDIVRVGVMNKALWLLHADFFIKHTMEKCIRDILLVDRPIKLDCKS